MSPTHSFILLCGLSQAKIKTEWKCAVGKSFCHRFTWPAFWYNVKIRMRLRWDVIRTLRSTIRQVYFYIFHMPKNYFTAEAFFSFTNAFVISKRWSFVLVTHAFVHCTNALVLSTNQSSVQWMNAFVNCKLLIIRKLNECVRILYEWFCRNLMNAFVYFTNAFVLCTYILFVQCTNGLL